MGRFTVGIVITVGRVRRVGRVVSIYSLVSQFLVLYLQQLPQAVAAAVSQIAYAIVSQRF